MVTIMPIFFYLVAIMTKVCVHTFVLTFGIQNSIHFYVTRLKCYKKNSSSLIISILTPL